MSFEHRRAWIEKRIFKLAQVFSIGICAHAVMHNHLHLVLRVDSEQVKNWSTSEVLKRWHQLFKGTYLTRQYQKKQALDTKTKSNGKIGNTSQGLCSSL